jgi:hypothetical protein
MITNKTHHYCQDSAIYQIIHLTYPNFDFKIIELSKGQENFTYLKKRYGEHIIKGKWFENANERTANGREMFREIAIKENFDFIFYMDADWIIPTTILERLLSHEKDLVGVLYNYGRGKMSYPSVAKGGGLVFDGSKAKTSLDRLNLYTWEDILEMQPRLIKCYGAGIGLVSRKVFEKVGWRHCPYYPLGDDVQFWNETNDKGFQWWADLSFKITHLNTPWNNKVLNEVEEIEVKRDIKTAK